VQEARKNSGFDVSDRIALTWQATGETAEALRENGPLVADEVLAVEMREGELPTPEDAAAEGAQLGADGVPARTVVHDGDLGLTFSVVRL
jgi:isoleucyl-tRNA synthetase